VCVGVCVGVRAGAEAGGRWLLRLCPRLAPSRMIHRQARLSKRTDKTTVLKLTDKTAVHPRRLAFGMVTATNEQQTAYVLRIVAEHCRHVHSLYKAKKWDI
jgi:hypothetical protein